MLPAGPSDALTAALTLTGEGVDAGANSGITMWTFNLPSDAVDFLGAGETLTVTYTLTATDDSGDGATDSAAQTVTITITGTNDAPVVTSDADQAQGTLEEPGERNHSAIAGTLIASGQLAATNVDAGDVLTWSAETTSALGTFVITEAGAWTFTLDPEVANSLAEGDTRTENFTAIVKDGRGGSAEQIVTVTIQGTNDAPVISVTSVTTGGVTETGNTPPAEAVTASGTLAATDPDTGDKLTWSIVGSTAGTYGSLSLEGAP